MTKETTILSEKIKEAKLKSEKGKTLKKEESGYQIATNVIVDLFGCVLISTAIGVICQNLFGTSIKFTAGMAIIGGIAGLYTVVKNMRALEKKNEG